MIEFSILTFFVVIGFSYCQNELCTSRCESSYPLHTVDKVVELHACLMGCRLQFITQLSGKHTGSCASDCKGAFASDKGKQIACINGCELQSTVNSKEYLLGVDDSSSVQLHMQLLYPVFTVKEYCFNMFHHATSYVSSSSYMVESSSNGDTFVMKLEMAPFNSQNQQFEVRLQEDPPQEGKSSTSTVKYYMRTIHGHASRWLNCVERRAGIPYSMLVAVLILLLAMVGWICYSICDDSTEDTVEQKKHTFKGALSIRADDMDDVPLFTIVNSEGGAGPLPEKQSLLKA